MPQKNPENWSWFIWALLTAMSLLGGISNWHRRVKEGHPHAFNAAELAGEIAMSGMMGFVGFAVADNFFDSIALAASAAGICSHFSTRLLFGAEGIINAYTVKYANKIKDEK